MGGNIKTTKEQRRNTDMMHNEFEKIAGYEVSYDDYKNIIEPMYMATNLDKYEFVKTLDRKRFDLGAKKRNLIKEMKKIAAHLKENCTHYTDYEAQDRLNELVKEYKGLRYHFPTSYGIHEEMLWTCYYPQSIEIFETEKYITIETIKLI